MRTLLNAFQSVDTEAMAWFYLISTLLAGFVYGFLATMLFDKIKNKKEE